MGYGTKKVIIIVGAMLAALILVFFYFWTYRLVIDREKVENNEDVEIAKEPVLVAPIFPPKVIGDEKFYKNILLRFSISFPKNLTIKEYDEGRGSLIVFEDEKGGKGFQIFAVPYEGVEVSKERFKMDVPSGVMKEPVDVVINGTPVKAFFSKSGLIGETREVWFIKNGFLYEVTTYAELDLWLAKIMQSWRFL